MTRMNAGRADSENRIKELKEDLSLDTFCLKSFDATDAAFRMAGCCTIYWRTFGRPCCHARGLKSGSERSGILSFWSVPSDPPGHGSEFSFLCQSLTDRSCCAVCERCRRIADCGAVGMESVRPNPDPSRQSRFSDSGVSSAFSRQSVALNFSTAEPGISTGRCAGLRSPRVFSPFKVINCLPLPTAAGRPS